MKRSLFLSGAIIGLVIVSGMCLDLVKRKSAAQTIIIVKADIYNASCQDLQSCGSCISVVTQDACVGVLCAKPDQFFKACVRKLNDTCFQLQGTRNIQCNDCQIWQAKRDDYGNCQAFTCDGGMPKRVANWAYYPPCM
jgi:hypothetical protein